MENETDEMMKMQQILLHFCYAHKTKKSKGYKTVRRADNGRKGKSIDYEELQKMMKEQKCEMTAVEWAFSEIFGYTTVQMNKDFEIEKAIIQRAREGFGHSGLSVGLGLRTLGDFGSEAFEPEHGIDYLTSHILKDYQDFHEICDKEVRKNKLLLGML